MSLTTGIQQVFRGLKARIPWQGKVLAKIVLARIPLDYRTWKKLALFEHGRMEDPEYAFGASQSHIEKARSVGKGISGATVLELGPGDTLSSAVVARALGAARAWLVDVGQFALPDLDHYRDLLAFLRRKNLPVDGLEDCRTLEELLEACAASYLTQGLASLRQIASGSVDIVWSQAVLEHVRREEFPHVIRELRRIQHPSGVGSHVVDLKDHLGGALNNLRFSERVWESRLMRQSGFYTNRIRFGEMLRIFEEAGFRCQATRIARWPKLPTPRRKLARAYTHLPEEDLTVHSFDVLLR